MPKIMNVLSDNTNLANSRFMNFDIEPKASQEQKHLALLEKLLPSHRRKRDNTIIAWNKLGANLLHFRRPILIHMDRTFYSHNFDLYGISPTITEHVHTLHDAKLIDFTPGSYAKHKVTEIQATDDYLKLFDYDDEVDYRPRNLVILRHWELQDGEYVWHTNSRGKRYSTRKYLPKRLPFDPTPETRKRENLLRNYYDLAHTQDVTLYGKRLQTALRCIYIDDFKHVGRFFTGTGHGVQSQKRADRPHILINGNKTVELDFRSLHPNMLNTKRGRSPEMDMYRKLFDYMPDITNSEHEVVRQFIKFVYQCMLNNDLRDSAVKSAQFNRDVRDPDKWQSSKSILESLKVHVDDIVAYYEKLLPHHKKYFFKSYGAKLQHCDSVIAYEIIKHFTTKNVLVLPIHDSFIVEAKYQDDLQLIMNESYCKVMKTNVPCPIKIA